MDQGETKTDAGKIGELKNALFKKAIGYDATETVEEYSDADGQLVLVKRKITKKSVPPDISALKMLLDENDDEDLSSMSDEQLEEERKKLTQLLKEK